MSRPIYIYQTVVYALTATSQKCPTSSAQNVVKDCAYVVKRTTVRPNQAVTT